MKTKLYRNFLDTNLEKRVRENLRLFSSETEVEVIEVPREPKSKRP